ncbi:MAG: hypothetical protein E6441_12320 [Clostridium sp.]|uniref:hypothetical protein n=1 Tax=Clostridium sp. TaxID=1506 RepID=UPI00290910CC|nr:hypothetical protein [Clostridium sp.]MDU5211114.1 hypothetical protein [Clostridium sp.]MDU6762241.1 hypothetical protein [Clostridium sp.]
MNIDLPLTLSLIGCITGCASLAINFHKFLTEQFKLKIYFSENNNIFFGKLKDSNCKTNFQGIVRINFVNKSSSPVTIYAIETKIDDKTLINRKYEETSITLISEVFTEHKYASLVFPMDKQIELPLRIAPFDSYEGFLFFPFFPDTTNNSEIINFTFKTTKKTIHKKHTLLKFETKVHDNCNDDYI